MAKKKSRRVPQSSTPRLYSNAPLPPAGQSTTARPPAAPAPAARPSAASSRTVSSAVRSNVPLSVEYKYVAGDLRRLGITAVSFFAMLIAVGIVAYILEH
jgi:hypothetical protein